MTRDRNIEAIYPLSPMQQGMLFHMLYSWESGVYFRQLSWALHSTVDVPCMQQVWREIMRRHAILRTGFLWELEGEPLQVVQREVPFPWAEHDWRHLSADRQQEELARLLEHDRAQPFDLARAPLMRLILIRLGEASYRFVWSYPHLLLDGWSRTLVLNETLALYHDLLGGAASPLPPSPQYRAYINWLRRQDEREAESYWRAKLKGFTWPLNLGIGREAAENQGVNRHYGELEDLVPAPLSTALTALARRHQVTLSTVVQTAWALLIGRYSCGDNAVYGLTVAGRPPELAGIESMAGLFINTLPMRVHLDVMEPAMALAGRIQAQQLDLGRYEWSSLLKVQEWSEMAPGEPLFENIVVFENYPVDESAVPAALESELGLEMSHEFDKTNFPLELVAAPGARIYLRVSYDNVRFERVEIQRLLGHLVRLFAGIAAAPMAPAGELDLLRDAERHQLLCERLGLHAPETADDLMHRLFERQVEKTPAAPAVAGPGGMSYDQLNRRANRLARLLRSHGAGAGRPLALLAHRGADFLTAMLAAFKAGSPYLPLSPGQPVPRYVQILERSGAPLALASREHAATLAAAVAELPAGGAPRVLLLEELLERAADERDLADACAPQETAYVIFTSGSTGAPKGAMVEHRGMLNHLLAKVVDLELSSRDVLAQTAAQSFDISVWQFLAVLLVGGAVRVYPEETANDPALLLDSLEADGITVFETVPALLRLIVQEAQHRGAARPALASLRWALATGDVLPPAACRDWLGLYPGVPVVNAYGPTECSDDV
ncbi:MAG TPA: condensation domain-containing protein, partial [Thermoanaerobaculia bacterium]